LAHAQHGITAACLAATLGAQAVDFSSPQVHPLAVAADGRRLLTVNTPDGRVALWSLLDPDRPVLLREVKVGIEPISVAWRTPDEAWVVNHLSDTVSVVDLRRGLVTDTLHVPDEPMDVAFAGGKAFVSIAGKRVVRAFDATSRRPLGDVPVFGQDPAALAVSADGTRVWVAIRLSGNKTTVVPEHLAPPQPPPANPTLPPAPRTSLIVASDDPRWRAAHGVVLPDHDVFELDAATLAVTRSFAGAGTVLFDVAPRPGTDELWVANTEARNLVRFAPALRGHAVDNRVTRVDLRTASVAPIDLNPGIDYALLPNPAALATALAQPTGLAWSPDGGTLFVAAYGTDRIGVLDPAGNVRARIEVGPVGGAQVDPRRKRGPRGVVHHPLAPRLYVLNRLSNSFAVVDTVLRRVVREVALPDPTDARHKSARGFLYDAKLSGNGTMSCASCHVDGVEDGLAWDLGDPGGALEPAFDRVRNVTIQQHPMKGPMLTQTLHGLDGVSPFHWRGDRARLQDFNGTFAEVMGGARLTTRDMDDFVAFLAGLVYPPNPNQNLDGSLPDAPYATSARRGFDLYLVQPFNGGARCVDCHAANPLIVPGALFGRAQDMNIPALRNTYKHARRTDGPQGSVTGFGLLHDGSVADVAELLRNPAFGPLAGDAQAREALENFVLAVNIGVPAITGHGSTVRADNLLASIPTLLLLLGQAEADRCDLVAGGELDGRLAGLLYDGRARLWRADRAADAPLTTTALLDAIARGRARVTLLAVLAGFGRRLGIDRNLDGVLDGDEGVDRYGAPSPQCAGVLELTSNGPARVGDDRFAVSVAGLPHAQAGLLLVGGRTSLWLGGLEFLVDTSLGFRTLLPVDGGGTGVLNLPIPPDPVLAGQTAHLQAVVPAACAPQGLAASQGLRVVIQR
jgi:DNA-binding beta-propeller fold protein YncE